MLKDTIFVCFALCLLFQFGGCSLFSDKTTSEKSVQKSKATESQDKNNSDDGNKSAIDKAQGNLNQATIKFQQKIEELKPDKKKVEEAKRDCGTMTNQSIAAKNPDYKKPDSKTGQKCSEAKQLESDYNNELKPFQAEVKNAENELENLKQSSSKLSPIESGSDETESKSSDWLLPLLAGIAGLLLIGGISFLIYRISKNNKHERAATQDGFRSIGAKQSGLRQEVDQLKTATELLSKQLSEQRNEIAALKSQARRDNSFAEPPPSPQTFSPSFAPPAPEFPVSVETYLAKNAGGAAFGKHDPLFGTLKENNDDGAFYLIRDGVLSDDARYAVPRTKQFVTKDDFVYHYSNYYVCANPSGGEVWIKKPSTVRRTADGWKLDATGELEIR